MKVGNINFSSRFQINNIGSLKPMGHLKYLDKQTTGRTDEITLRGGFPT